MAAWCICPLFPALVNGIGAFGGLYEGGNQVLDPDDQFGECRTGAAGCISGRAPGCVPRPRRSSSAASFMRPLCVIELRFSPQLHNWVYGYHQHDFVQTIRDGGYPADGLHGARADGCASGWPRPR